MATSEAIRESISLSFCKRVLVFEWRTSPAQALQLMGRFARQDADVSQKIHVQYVVRPGEETRAEILVSRIRDINQLFGTGHKNELLGTVFQPRPQTEEYLENMFAAMMSTVRDTKEWEDEDP